MMLKEVVVVVVPKISSHSMLPNSGPIPLFTFFVDSRHKCHHAHACRFFGGGGPFGGFGGFGGGYGEEEEQTPKGNNVYVELEVTLKDLFLGNTFTVCHKSFYLAFAFASDTSGNFAVAGCAVSILLRNSVYDLCCCSGFQKLTAFRQHILALFVLLVIGTHQ